MPIDQQAAIVEIEVNSAEPVAVEAAFTPDVAWMWPAAVGDAYSKWDAQRKAFLFSSDHSVFWAIAGAAGGNPLITTSSTNYSAVHTDVFSFGPAAVGHATYRFVMTASFESQKAADEQYRKLLAADSSIVQQASNYYTGYLDNTVQLSLPDPGLQLAYDWARISTVQGLVDEPFAGKGLVAGYNISSGSPSSRASVGTSAVTPCGLRSPSTQSATSPQPALRSSFCSSTSVPTARSLTKSRKP